MAVLLDQISPTIGANNNPMKMLFGSSGDHNNQIVPYGEHLMSEERPGASAYAASEESGSSIEIGKLIRRYWILLLALMILGAAAGFTSVVLSSPMYRSKLMLEVQSSGGLWRPGEAVNADMSEVENQTQVQILRSGSFLKRGADRMQSDSPALAPTGRDIFSRLRQRIHQIG